MDWWSIARKILTAALAAWATRNASVTGSTVDPTVLAPLAGASISLGWGAVLNFFRGDGTKNALKLVAQILPYRERMAPQEIIDSVFAVLDWRFRKRDDAIKLLDQLIQIDMEMSRVADSKRSSDQ